MMMKPDSLFHNSSGFLFPISVLDDKVNPLVSDFISYIERPEFRQGIHVGNLTFTYLNATVQQAMLEEFMASKAQYVEELLNANIYKVIVAVGQFDLTVSYQGVNNFVNSLNW